MARFQWRTAANAQWLGNLLLALTLAGVFSLHSGISGLRDAYDGQTAVFLATAGVQPMSTDFTDSNGLHHTVNTPRITPEEPFENVLARHAADLAAARAAYQ